MTSIFIGGAVLLSVAVLRLTDDVYPYSSFYPAIFLAAWICGARSGVVTYIAGILSGGYFFKHYGHLEFFSELRYIVPTLVFSFANFTTIWLSRKYRFAIRDLTQARDEIQAAAFARDEFLSMASHELKTPLTSIKMQIQMAIKSTFLNRATIPLSELTNIFNNCERQILRITSLVNDLLDVSLLQSKRLRYKFEYVNLSKVVIEVCEMYKDVAAESGSALIMQVEPHLFARLDTYRFEQVIVNLIANAMKYGNGKPFTVAAFKEQNNAVVQVRDHGIGIAQEKWGRIFEQYERAVPEHNFNGLGLGLFIARSIVESHNGKIGFTSELGKGSTFEVRVPLVENIHIKEIKRADTPSGGIESHKLST